MDVKKLEKIEQAFVKPERKQRFLFVLIFVVLSAASVVGFKIYDKEPIPCYISPDQKSHLKDRIASIAASKKVSEYTLFRGMKKALKYDTIGRIPCNRYNAALEYLDDAEKQIMK